MSQIQKKIYITDNPTRMVIDGFYSDLAEINNTSQSYEMQEALLYKLRVDSKDKQFWVDNIYFRPKEGVIDTLHDVVLNLKLASINELKTNKESIKNLIHLLGVILKGIKDIDDYYIGRFRSAYDVLADHMISILPAIGIDNSEFFNFEINELRKRYAHSVEVNDIAYSLKIIEKFIDNVYLTPLLYAYLTELTCIVDLYNNATNRIATIQLIKELKWN